MALEITDFFPGNTNENPVDVSDTIISQSQSVGLSIWTGNEDDYIAIQEVSDVDLPTYNTADPLFDADYATTLYYITEQIWLI